jgi:lysosomal-associated membrane protein 1/2
MNQRLSLLSVILLASLSYFASAATTTPSSSDAKWSVSDNGTVCILASFNGTFLIDYNATSPANKNETYNRSVTIEIPDSATVSNRSMCSAYTTKEHQQLVLTWMDRKSTFNLTLEFGLTSENETELRQVSLEYDLSNKEIFANATNNGLKTASSSSPTGVVIPAKKYLQCNSGVMVALNDTAENEKVSAEMVELKLEAFRLSNTKTFDGNADVCPNDIPTTPVPVRPTTPVPPAVQNYTVDYPHTNTTCLIADFDLGLSIVYKNNTGHSVNVTMPLLNNGVVNSNLSRCENESAVLAIGEFLPGWTLELIFNRTSDMFYLTELTLMFNLNDTEFFPAANYTGNQTVTATGINSWSAHNGRSFKCDLVSQFKLNTTSAKEVESIYISLDHILAQAFISNGTVGDPEVCNSGDNDTSEIVPIAVGCALAALVVIVLIAYVIGRRRNRARGYESM